MSTVSEKEIVALEEQRIAATIGGDVATLERLFADDLTYIHSSARPDTKQSFIDDIRTQRLRYLGIDVEERAVRVTSEAAIVTGISRMHVAARGQENRFRIRFLLVWVRRPAGWQVAAWQSTKLPE